MKKAVFLFVVGLLIMLIQTTPSSAWANVEPGTCVAAPGPGYCTCYWWTDDLGKKVPNSDVCDNNLDGVGGCTKDANCNNPKITGSVPTTWPSFNIGAYVPLAFWVF